MRVGIRLPLFFLVAAGMLSADIVVHSFNIGQPLTNCCYNGDTDIGWYYTPSTSYVLDQVETVFSTSTNPSDPITSANVTVAIFTDTPAKSGLELGSGSYTAVDGTLDGPTFTTGIPLVGGVTYFVGLEGVQTSA